MANSMDEGDRISMLPDEIIGCILSFLPMKRAIKTGVLSKRWRDLWKFNPVLEFSSFPISRAEVVDYSFINHCLSLYIPSRIEKLIIVLNVGFVSRPNIADWVDFAIAKHVRSLEFYWVFCTFNCEFFELPKSFYAEKNKDSLVNLVLSGVRFSSPQLASGFGGFRFLKSLTLYKSLLRDEELEAIITACLVLERLALQGCFGHYRVKVSSRVLKEFKFYPGEKAEDLEIIAPNLVNLKILLSLNIIRLDKSCNLLEATLIDFPWELEKSRVQKFMGQLTMVKVLSATHWLLEFLIEEHYANGKRCALFKSLKEFYFHGSQLLDEYNMVMFIAFLEDCPLLSKIHIDFRTCTWHGIHKKLPSSDRKPTVLSYRGDERLERPDYFAELHGGEQLPQVGLLHQVKSIELLYFSGFKYEMELVKRMLEKTSSLERLSLLFEDPEQFVIHEKDGGLVQFQVSLQQRELLLEEICLFPRASPHAQILII